MGQNKMTVHNSVHTQVKPSIKTKLTQQKEGIEGIFFVINYSCIIYSIKNNYNLHTQS